MKTLAIILTTAAALTGCGTFTPSVKNTLTVPADWIGPNAEGQHQACKAAYATAHPYKVSPTQTAHVSVDGTPHSVTYDALNPASRAARTTEYVSTVNRCMVDAGYRWEPYPQRLIDTVSACEATSEVGTRARQECVNAGMAASAK